MEDNHQNSKDSIIDKAKDYIETRIELLKLTLIEKGVRILANSITGISLFLILFFTILFASFGLGFYLSEVIGNTFAGFFIVAGIYLLLALLIYVLKDKVINKKIMDAAIKGILKQDANDENKY